MTIDIHLVMSEYLLHQLYIAIETSLTEFHKSVVLNISILLILHCDCLPNSAVRGLASNCPTLVSLVTLI